MTTERVMKILKETGVLREGHFLLTSGRHSDKYMQCAKIFQNSKYSTPLCGELVKKLNKDSVDIVIGPAMGAVQMAYEVGRQLNCPNFFSERVDGEMTLRRGFSISKGQRILVVEDVITTGGSVKEVIELVHSFGGEVVGVGVIVDRSNGKIDFGVPLYSVVSMEVLSYESENCLICKTGLPLIKPGSRIIK